MFQLTKEKTILMQPLFSLLQCTTTPVNGKWRIMYDLIWDVNHVSKTHSLCCLVLFQNLPSVRVSTGELFSLCSKELATQRFVIKVSCSSDLQHCFGSVLEKQCNRPTESLQLHSVGVCLPTNGNVTRKTNTLLFQSVFELMFSF